MSATSEALQSEEFESARSNCAVTERLRLNNIPEPSPPDRMLGRFSLNGSPEELKQALELTTQAIDWVSWELGRAEAEKSNLARKVDDCIEKEFLLIPKADGTEKFRTYTAQRKAAHLSEKHEEACKVVFMLHRRLMGLKEQKDTIQSIWWAKKAGMI